MSYQFLDANSSILTAQSSTVGSVHYPIVISSFSSAQPVTFTGASSVSGTVGASVIGTVPTTQSGLRSTSVVGTLNLASITGAVTLFAQPDSYFKGVSSTITGTAAVSVIAAAGSSLRHFITNIQVTNAAATATIVDIKDGADILNTGYAAASGGGWSSSFPVPIRQGTANAPIEVVSRSQASILVAISGFKAA